MKHLVAAPGADDEANSLLVTGSPASGYNPLNE